MIPRSLRLLHKTIRMKIFLTIFSSFILSLCFSSCSSEESYNLKLSPTNVSVDATGETFTLTVTCDTDYSVNVSDNWLTLNSKSSGTLSFTAEANTSSSSRTATVTVTAGDLSATATVTQAGTEGSEGSDDSGDDASGTINGYEYVYLGLSVKWATRNIGADSPEEYGDYYAWGETETKDTYTSSNNVTNNVEMDDFSGDAEYDAATANWGNPWRMPTGAELGELQGSCTWTLTTLNGVKGYEVTGTNGNSIFLPAAGSCGSSGPYGTGSYGCYWSSTPFSSEYVEYGTVSLEFDSEFVSMAYGFDRYFGYSVRPVTTTSARDEISLSVSPKSVNVAAAGESFTVTVTCDTVYNVDMSDTWLILNSNSNGTLSFTAEANTSDSSRAATITVTAGTLSKTVTVTQEEVSLSVSPTDVSVTAAGESFTVTVTCNRDYSVDVSDDWLTLESDNDGTLDFIAEANTSGSSRTSTITVTAGDLSSTVEVVQNGTLNGYEYVDLGLSVKWASCNIGADSPEEYGDYYAWGETETKDTYTSSNSVTYGVEMDDFSGDAEYDAATANWGSPWRMPTSSETYELFINCTWTWTTMDDVNGYEVTGTNGNSIFLPAAGYRGSSSLYGAGSEGYYWSSTSYTAYTRFADYLYFNLGYATPNSKARYLGLSIRPVSEQGD